MKMRASYPIGIFDSGIGGLTVAKAVKEVFPNEKIIYYGDTAHLPYGDKSGELITHYSVNITDFLLKHDAKVILIACNSASASAFEEVQKHVGDRALVMNVIDPVVEYVANQEGQKKVGVIGTKATVNSGMYERKLRNLSPDFDVISMATPLLAPMIEEGFIYDNISNAIIDAYLSNSPLNNLDSLILGCTHYPIIKNQIRRFYDFNVRVIDSGLIVAKELYKQLNSRNLLNHESQQSSADEFYVSDYTAMFGKISRMFFEEDIPLQQNNIWT